jgi:hypothetical protein
MLTFKTYFLENRSNFDSAARAYHFADNARRRIPEAEEAILKEKDPKWIYLYAEYVIHGHWPDGEEILKSYPIWAHRYSLYAGAGVGFIVTADKWSWIKGGGLFEQKDGTYAKEDLSKDLIRTLNYFGMNHIMQRYICDNRPDLINEINPLEPELAKKYKHEKELGNLDL